MKTSGLLFVTDKTVFKHIDSSEMDLLNSRTVTVNSRLSLSRIRLSRSENLVPA